MSRQEMADVLGVTPGTITRWTRDEGAPPRPPVLYRWAELCNVPLDWLTDGVGSVEEPVRSARDRAAAAKDTDLTAKAMRALAHDGEILPSQANRRGSDKDG